MKNQLEGEKESIVRKMANDLYDVKTSGYERAEFEERFAKNYINRNYTNNFTEYLSGYETKENGSKDDKCAQKFSEIYCGQQKRIASVTKDQAKIKCLSEKMPDVIVNYLSSKYKDIKSPQSICDFESKFENMSNNPDNEMFEHISNFYSDDKIYLDGGFCSTRSTSLLMSQESSRYSLGNADAYNIESSSTENLSNFILSSDKARETANEIVNSISPAPKSTTTLGNAISSEILNSLDSKSTNKNIRSKFSDLNVSTNNFDTQLRKNNQEDEKEEEAQISSISSNEQDLIDYINNLESQIANKEKKLNDSKKRKDTTEISKLRAEIDALKNKTKKLKDSVTSSSIITPKNNDEKQVVNKVVPKTYFDNSSSFTSVPNNNTVDRRRNEPSSNQLRPSTTGPSIDQGNNVHLTSSSINNIAPQSSASSPLSSSKTIQVNYNNQDFKIQLSVKENGELTCSFNNEETGDLSETELDKICDEYKLKEKKRSISSTAKTNLKKEVENKDIPKRSQKFKVKDLNSILKN